MAKSEVTHDAEGVKILTVAEVLEVLLGVEDHSTPCAVYELKDGLRFGVIHVDTDCSGVVDFNFNGPE